MHTRQHDVMCIGRCTLDLYGEAIGVDFTEQTSFRAYVGGCPTNICVAVHRLGLQAVMVTGVSADHVGDYLRAFFQREGLMTDHVYRIPGTLNNLVIGAAHPPDRIQLVPYHVSNSDLMLNDTHVRGLPIADSHILLFSGMGFLQEPSRSATRLAAEIAQGNNTTVFMDADYRPRMWASAAAYREATQAVLPLVDVLIGTDEEINALADMDDADASAERLLHEVQQAVIVKRGADGATVYPADAPVVDVPPFSVEPVNVMGAGDAFAGGVLYGWRQGWPLTSCVRFGAACGALIVQEHGTADAMPTLAQVQALLEG